MSEQTEVLTYEEILSQMQGKYRELTGFDADAASDIGIRLRVLAEQVAGLYGRLGELGRQVFPQTSEGEALERHAACRGLARKPARAAEGVLRFSRATAAASDIPIPAGVICATRPEPQIQFETTQDAVLRAGSTSVEVPARAAVPGGEGNVAGGAVCLMISAAPGVTSVTNPSPFSGGSGREDDGALRTRLLDAYRNISNGTNSAFYYDLAMQHEKVASAAVLPRARGRGTVDIVVQCTSKGIESSVVKALQTDLDRRKEINVDVLVSAAKPRVVEVDVALAVAEGFEYDAVVDACSLGLIGYTNRIGVGKPLLVARLVEYLLSIDGVYNARILTPKADIRPEANEILRVGMVSIERMVTG